MKDKISFAVGVLGALLALAPFTNQLNLIIVDFGFASASILTLAYISFLILFLSIYLFALEFVKDGFKFLDAYPIFRYLEISGNILYFLAVFSPILYLITWFFAKVIQLIQIPQPELKEIGQYLSLFVSIISVCISIFAAVRKNKQQVLIREETLDESAITASNEARKLVNQRMWSLSIVEAYRSLELNINKKILELGFGNQNIPINQAVEILIHKGVFNNEDTKKFSYIRNIRNQSVHSSINYSEDDALEIINLVNSLVNNLDLKSGKSRFIEEGILNLLTNKNGLFDYKKIEILKNIDRGIDAIAEGPNSKQYFINIKLSTNQKIIQNAIDRMNDLSKPSERKILIVPNVISNVVINDKNLKILYFDEEKNCFSNTEELRKWIYE